MSGSPPPCPTRRHRPPHRRRWSGARIGATALAPGTALVDAGGRALYLFEADQGTTSTCNGLCAQVWPPLLTDGAAPAVAGDVQASLLGSTARDDGTQQVTYNGHPLYYFTGDKNPGETRGQGLDSFGGPWYVVTPAGNKIDPDDAGAGTGSPPARLRATERATDVSRGRRGPAPWRAAAASPSRPPRRRR